MASKEQHYAHQLATCLSSGKWSASTPAKAPGYAVASLSWSELFRKFRKHSPANKSKAVVAEHIHALGLLIENGTGKEKDRCGDYDLMDSKKGKHAIYPLDLGRESVLPPEHVEEVKAGYKTLQNLESEGEKSDFLLYALAYYAYALGDPKQCQLYLEKAPDVSILREFIGEGVNVPLPGPSTSGPSTAGAQLTVPITLTATNTSTASFSSIAPTSKASAPNAAEVAKDMHIWSLTEVLRTVCLKGMTHETLNPTFPSSSLAIYITAYPLLNHLNTLLAPSNRSSSPQTHSRRHYYSYHYHSSSKSAPDNNVFANFTAYEETHRWAERLLWRWTVLASRVCNVFEGPFLPSSPNLNLATATPVTDKSSDTYHSQTQNPNLKSLWTPLLLHTSLSSHWPPSFRSAHRITVHVIGLRAYILLHSASSLSQSPSSSASSSPTSTSSEPGQIQIPQIPNALLPRNVVPSYRSLLSASTAFPKAGQRNWAVEDCVRLVTTAHLVSSHYGHQPGSPGSVGWVLDVLWWSTTLTFNCPLVYRHLSRLLYLSGDARLSRRVLGVYVQVVGKAWEARTAGVGAADAPLSESNGKNEAGKEKVNGEKEEDQEEYELLETLEDESSGVDVDESEEWVRTCVFGARMLARSAAGMPEMSAHAPLSFGSKAFQGDVSSAKDLLKEARNLTAKARERLEDVRDEGSRMTLESEAELAEGVVLGAEGVRETNDLSKRAGLLKDAHEHLQSAVQVTDRPTAGMYYHLALSWLRIGAIEAHGYHPSTSTLPSTETQVNGNANLHATNGGPSAPIAASYLDGAFEAATSAVALDPTEVRHWHLLGLVLCIQERWSEARDVLERGCALGNDEDDEAEDQDQEDGEEANGGSDKGVNGEKEKDRIDGLPKENGGAEQHPLLRPEPAYVIPPSSASTAPRVNGVESNSEKPKPKPRRLRLPPVPKHPFKLVPHYIPKTKLDVFSAQLQIRMTLGAVVESVLGPEGASEYWVEVFAWVAERTLGGSSGSSTNRTSTIMSVSQDHSHVDRNGTETDLSDVEALPDASDTSASVETNGSTSLSTSVSSSTSTVQADAEADGEDRGHDLQDVPLPPVPGLNITPATPDDATPRQEFRSGSQILFGPGSGGPAGETRRPVDLQDTLGRESSASTIQAGGIKRSNSLGLNTGGKKGKKMQRMLKNRVHKETARISTMTKKVNKGVVAGLRRSNSTPDFHAILRPTSIQASSIHSRRRRLSLKIPRPSGHHDSDSESAPPPPSLSTTRNQEEDSKHVSGAIGSRWNEKKKKKENRLRSDLWLMSAATFRRLGKIEQAKGAIQEAEVLDEENPGVWVQLGLYYAALGRAQAAIDSLQKALFICPDDIPASVHLCRLWLSSASSSLSPSPPVAISSPISPTAPATMTSLSRANEQVDLAAGLLSHLTKGPGWDVPEAWYFLAKAYGMQDRKERERACLVVALKLSERRSVRAAGDALGLCL